MSLNLQSWILVSASILGLVTVYLKEKLKLHEAFVWSVMIIIALYWVMYSWGSRQYGFLCAAGLAILIFILFWFVEWWQRRQRLREEGLEQLRHKIQEDSSIDISSLTVTEASSKDLKGIPTGHVRISTTLNGEHHEEIIRPSEIDQEFLDRFFPPHLNKNGE